MLKSKQKHPKGPYQLGITATLDPAVWSSDFRERLPEGHRLRAGFKGSPVPGSKESVESLAKLHRAALLLTKIQRP